MDVDILKPSAGSKFQHNGAPFDVEVQVTNGVPDAVLARFFQTIGGTLQLVLTVDLIKNGSTWESSVSPSSLNIGDATLKCQALKIEDSQELGIEITSSASSSSSSGGMSSSSSSSP